MAKPLEYLSASQITLFMECPTKWYNTYVLGMRPPSTPAQIFGTELHTVAENWLRYEIEPDDSKVGRCFREGIDLLPPPKTWFDPPMLIEHGFNMVIDGSPLPLKGFIDLYFETEKCMILDHKTSSSKRYVKTPAELKTNPQLITYAAYAFQELTKLNKATLTHVYYGTRQRFAERVSVEVSRSYVKSYWRELVSVMHEMIEVHSKHSGDVKKNFGACKNYGGCSFTSRCLTPTKENTTMGQSTLDQLLKQADGKKPLQNDNKTLTRINPPESGQVEEVIPITEPSVEDSSPVQVERKQPSTSTKRVLFIRCLPSKNLTEVFGKVTEYSDLVAPITKAICEQYDVPHISMVGQYGDGYKHIAGVVAQPGWWSEDTPCIYINPMESKGCDYVMDVLKARADIIVKGH